MERREVEEVSNEVEERQDLRFKVFVGGLDKYAKEEDLRKVFGGVEEVTKVRLSWDSESKKRVAFLTFATVELARRAICEISDPVINDKRCWTAQIQDGSKTLYVPNICKEWTKDDLEDKLAEYGVKNYDVLTLNPARENKEKNRGYAHLDFRSRKDASEALELLKKENVSFGQNRAAKADFSRKYVSGNDEIMSHVKAWADLAKPRVRIPSEGTAQASSSVAQEIGRGNEVQQDSHRSHTDAPSAIDPSERSEVRIPSEGTAQASSSVAQEIGRGNEVQQDSHRSHTDAPSAIDHSERSEVRIPSEGTAQASSSVAQEIGRGNEVQQDSHRFHTDAHSAIDRSERSETSCKPYNGGPRESSSPGDRNAVSHSVGRKKQFPSPERLNTGRPSVPSQGITRAAAHRPSRHNDYIYERNTEQPSNYYESHSRDYNYTSGSIRPHSSMEEVRPRSTEPFVQRSRARVDHENSSRNYSQWQEQSSRTGFGEGASTSARNYSGLSDTRTSTVASRGCELDRGDDRRMPSRYGQDYTSRDHPRSASDDAHEESHRSDYHHSRVKDGGSSSRRASRKYHKG
ncbi:PREDICTED: uncharacterized protein LOC105140559 isoform X4 [Populus euphratica]|uniref:Uncharacterized protein LOC105140559 isoform X4 n=1 Tax=Populus euphratica TaxID=75702 RepID=A0AAJ6VDD6_POPEU|nr:PREDICTED: uncharacterized protein LOC105140559 isoform X4 [Populus euphratica]